MEFPGWLDNAVGDSFTSEAIPRPKTATSPYFNLDPADYLAKTKSLIAMHPLGGPQLVETVLDAWRDIFTSNIGGFTIGREIRPAPQMMGFFLHELVPLKLAEAAQGWRRDGRSNEKDLVYIPDASYSIEIKTSSNKDRIFGNRSFGRSDPGKGKKAKDGYYLAINFQKWSEAETPAITKIRFGWLDHTDWVAQASESGQNSTLPAVVYNSQLLTFYTGNCS